MTTEPRAGLDEVLVRVHAAGIVVTGAGPTRTTEVRDVAGTVVAFGGGDGEGRFVVGEEVFGIVSGGEMATADHVVVPATALSGRPRTTSFAGSAALPSAAVTAWNGLIELAGAHAGLTVLVHHAASATGLYAIQLAALVGADVIAVGGATAAPLMRDLGAREVVSPEARALPSADIVFDPSTVDADLARQLTFEVPASAPRQQHRWRPAAAAPPFARGFAVRTPEPQLALIADLVDTGGLRPIVDRQFPLSEAPAARRHALTSSAPGSTVLVAR